MPEKTIQVGYTTYAIGRLDKATLGTSIIQVVCSDGSVCDIRVETATDKILDVRGDSAPFKYWLDNVQKQGA